MEYELFRSKLKPLVDRASISDIIGTSSSGEHPHRTAAMGLLLESSIREHRHRMSEKVMDTSQSDPTSHPERSTETPTAPTPTALLVPTTPVQPLVPVPASQPLSQSSSNSILASASAKAEPPPDSSTLPESGKETNVGRLEEPSANNKTDPPGVHTVRPACSGCGALASLFRPRSHNSSCPYQARKVPPIKCDGCGTGIVRGPKSCTNCHGEFKR